MTPITEPSSLPRPIRRSRRSNVFPFLGILGACLIATTACGDEFSSCESRKVCAAGGAGGSGGSVTHDAGAGGVALGGRSNHAGGDSPGGDSSAGDSPGGDSAGGSFAGLGGSGGTAGTTGGASTGGEDQAGGVPPVGGAPAQGGTAAGGKSAQGGAATGGGGSSSGGSGGSGGGADVTPPSVVSITPSNLATGVTASQQIAITFSETMNTASVTQALSITNLPSNAFSTIWDVTGKVLTITPSAGLAYATGTTPAGTPALQYVVSITNAARDLAGNALPSFSSSFTTLRRITQSIASGTPVLYSDYGKKLGDAPFSCSTVAGVAYNYMGMFYVFVPFDTTVMGSESSIVAIENETFSANQVAPYDDFYSLHSVGLKRLKYQAIDTTVLSAPVLHEFGVFASSAQSPQAMSVFIYKNDIAAANRQHLYMLSPTGPQETEIANGTQANFTCTGFLLTVVFLTI